MYFQFLIRYLLINFSNSEEEDMDFNVLRGQIVEDRDKVLFDEAVNCLNGNALRAAYITTWISTAESLKLKFYDMSSRDHEIKKKVIGKIEDLEQKQRPTDSFLIRSAKDFGLISAEQSKKLEHMKDMRGVYAHPLNAAPSDSEVELAIELSVNIVLSQPALLKHAFVQSLVTSIFENHHYLDDSTETVQKAAISTLNHVHSSVFPYFFKLLIENLNKVSKDFTKDLFERRGSVFLDMLLKCSLKNFSTESWSLEGLLHKYPSIITKVFVKEDYWTHLNDILKDAMIGHLIEPIGDDGEVETPSLENLTSVLNLYNQDLLNERHVERFKSAVEKLYISKKVSIGIPLEWYQAELISDLKTSNWYAQNPVIEAIQSLGVEKINTLDSEFLIELGRNILQAADGQARDAISFVSSLYKSEFKSSPYLVEGIFLETFINENKRFRFKRYRKPALSAVLCVNEQETDKIIDKAIMLLKDCSLRGWFNEETFEEYLEYLDEILNFKKLKGLKKEAFEKFNLVFKETCDRFKQEEEEEELEV